MNSLTEENYLKAVLALSAETGKVNVNDLSIRLGIKMPTVTQMMKKLADKKLVQYQRYKPIRLTETGKKEAAIIIRKHRLAEMFLVRVMGFGWEGVHEIAEQVEHIRSQMFFEKIDEMLGFPKIDPHGSPIPDKNGKIEWKHHVKMSDCKAGETVKLTAVLDSSTGFLKFLNSRGLKLGLRVKIISVEPFDGTMVVNHRKGQSETLSHTICERLLCEKI
ncbi:MAG TPA: metal-dependent transcriptional regulator [Bacteroidota bacterium]|nr:metal-dependent transcriptional regulator [Bacteroidota bacterium]